MKFLNRILTNQLGVSLPMVLVIVTGALASIGYVTVNLIPKLQDGKKKAEQAIQYRIFIGSLNDYIVHGIRERWCITATNFSAGVAETDMLIANSTDCASTKPMEEVVTFNGNLERVLWDNQTIGEMGDPNQTTIMGLNNARLNKTPPLTSRTLQKSEITLPDNKMKFRIPESVFNNMSNLHPLYTISKAVKTCFDAVDIEIEQIIDPSSPAMGDEKKLRISIEADIKETRLSCMAHKLVKSTTFYTFYPRRLHNFALIKYDDLDASKYNEFYGPVYLAGDLTIPSSPAGKSKSTIFYDSLTLGTFNGGTYKSGVYRAGRLADSAGVPYTFEERGDPYKSKQDSYDTFRGIMGGLRLDAVEDKGLYNIFDYTSTNSAQVNTLERCIDDNKVKTTPSVNDGTLLAYSSVTNTPTSPAAPDLVQFKIGYTKKNRFKPSISAPTEINNPIDDPAKKFIMTVPPVAAGTKAIATVNFRSDSYNDFRATIGDNTSIVFKIDLTKFNLTAAQVDAYILLFDSPTSSKASYDNLIPSGHVLKNLPEYINYKAKAEDLLDRCDQGNGAKASIAHCQTPFPTDYVVACDHDADSQCDNSSRYNAYTASRTALKNKLNDIKTALSAAGDAQMTLSLEKFQDTDGKDIINQKLLKINFSSKWKTFFPMLGQSPEIEFIGYHYGNDILKFRMENVSDNELIRLKKQHNNQLEDFDNFSDWHNTYNDANISLSDDSEPLTELDCPTGMGFADWDLDMSSSSNFAWNYANTPANTNVDTSDHSQLEEYPFDADANYSGHYQGVDDELTKSVVSECTIANNREFVYGFYACRKLIIQGGRSKPLNLIGTFIVRDLEILENNQPIRWHSVWTPMARDLVLTELHAPNVPICAPAATLADQTLINIIGDIALEEAIKKCSSQELVSNGPNNFTWTTVDPEIGIDPLYPAMTSQKVRRNLRWVMREDSRKDVVK